MAANVVSMTSPLKGIFRSADALSSRTQQCSESWDYLPKGYSEVRVKDVFPTFGGLKSSLSDSILIGYLEQRLQAVHVSPSISQAPRLMIE